MPSSKSCELVYFVAVSLDGFIAGPGGDVSRFLAQGDHLDAIVEHWPETLPAPFRAALGIEAPPARFGAVIMGWNTYALGYDQGLADPYPPLETVVCSRRHRVGADRVVQSDDPRAQVARLREAGHEIWLCGGGQLAAVLASEVDRLILKVNPIVLGHGVPLFDRGEPRAWQLEETMSFSSGVLFNTYR
ncbi:MAG: dihydrofolate reductase family protein [Myxococcota bacterium]